MTSYTGSLATHDGSTDWGWTMFNYTYVANTTQPTLIFGFETDSSRRWRLDGVSVVSVSAPGSQLLQDPSFESSATTMTGWNETTICCGSNSIFVGDPSSGAGFSCADGTNCLRFDCNPSNGFGFVSQSFSATVGTTYVISYYLRAYSSGSSSSSGSTTCAVTVI